MKCFDCEKVQFFFHYLSDLFRLIIFNPSVAEKDSKMFPLP